MTTCCKASLRRRLLSALLLVPAIVLIVGVPSLARADAVIALVIDRPFDNAWTGLEAAVKANKMGVVTRASASRGRKAAAYGFPATRSSAFIATTTRSGCWRPACRRASKRRSGFI